MTKLREPLSVEKILKSIISKLKENEIQEFTGKSISHFRKCSDPDDKDHNIHLNDAIKLDILSVKSQKGTPFLDHISLIINKEFSDMDKIEDVSRNLITIGGRIGNLMDTLIKHYIQRVQKEKKYQREKKTIYLMQSLKWRKKLQS